MRAPHHTCAGITSMAVGSGVWGWRRVFPWRGGHVGAGNARAMKAAMVRQMSLLNVDTSAVPIRTGRDIARGTKRKENECVGDPPCYMWTRPGRDKT